MDKDKLIEKIKQIEKNRHDSLEHADRHSLDGDFYRTVVNKINRQHDEKLSELLTSLTAPVPDGNIVLPSVEEAGKIALNIISKVAKLNALDEAFFIAGFQECIKYLTPKTPDAG